MFITEVIRLIVHDLFGNVRSTVQKIINNCINRWKHYNELGMEFGDSFEKINEHKIYKMKLLIL